VLRSSAETATLARVADSLQNDGPADRASVGRMAVKNEAVGLPSADGVTQSDLSRGECSGNRGNSTEVPVTTPLRIRARG